MDITQSVVAERDRGLLGGDYPSYHSQAVRKLHALRKRLGNSTPKGRKFTPKSPVTAENVAQNREWVQLLLVSSERAWADAMAMKSSQSAENTQKRMAGSTRKQIASRYKRAISYAQNLVEVVNDSTTSGSTKADVLEAKAYLALLQGGLDFEKGRWESCLGNYAISRLIYSAMASTSRKETFQDLLSATIDPSIRYAAYQLKLPRTKAIADVAIEYFPKSQTDVRPEIESIQPGAFTTSTEKSSAQSDAPSTLPTSITWRARKVEIEDASISQALGIAHDKEAALVKHFVSLRQGEQNTRELTTSFDDIINARQDSVDVTKSAIDELQNEGVDQGDARVQSLQVSRTAANYAVIEWRVARNRILCGIDDGLSFEPQESKRKPKPRKDGKDKSVKEESNGKKLSRLRERVVLYDSILQSIDSVKELPGVIADPEFVSELDGKRAYFHALKCVALGRSHALSNSVKESLALYARASDLAQRAASEVKPTPSAGEGPLKLEITSDQLKTLHTTSQSLALQYQALAELSDIDQRTLSSSKDKIYVPPLIERFHLNQFDDNLDLTNLVNYPAKLQPIPIAPLFFDQAWKYIQYPGRSQDSHTASAAAAPDAEANPEAKPAKKGWFGFGR